MLISYSIIRTIGAAHIFCVAAWNKGTTPPPINNLKSNTYALAALKHEARCGPMEGLWRAFLRAQCSRFNSLIHY